MTAFPLPVINHWHRAFATDRPIVHGTLSYGVSATLNPRRPAMILQETDGTAQAVVTPEVAHRIGLQASDALSVADLQDRLAAAGIALHDPDHLFYLATDRRQATAPTATARRLSEADRPAFDTFYHAASEQDREDAWVELDHWAVFGCFDGDRLVCAASMNLWDDSPIADLGVLTLPDARGKGFGRAVVQAINHHARQQGYEPQYRCQLDNRASVALAKSCGLALFGQWIVAAGPPASDDD